jgi:hypothetical protein
VPGPGAADGKGGGKAGADGNAAVGGRPGAPDEGGPEAGGPEAGGPNEGGADDGGPNVGGAGGGKAGVTAGSAGRAHSEPACAVGSS